MKLKRHHFPHVDYYLFHPLRLIQYNLVLVAMVHLPAEILHQILREIRYMDDVCLTPLATVNHHWQLVVEDILWEYLPITAENIDCFVAFIRGKYARQRSVRHIYFKAENFKDPAETKAESDNKSGQRSDTESIDSESLGNAKSFAAFRSEHMRFMSDISTLWN
jgi:hypothetical protein